MQASASQSATWTIPSALPCLFSKQCLMRSSTFFTSPMSGAGELRKCCRTRASNRFQSKPNLSFAVIGLVDFGMADQRLVDPFVEGGFIPVGRERVSANNLGFAILRARPGLFVDLGLVIAEGHLEPFFQTLGERSQEALGPSVVAMQRAMPRQFGVRGFGRARRCNG